MANLLKETKEILKDNHKSLDDILWCGSKEFGYFTKEDFIKLADTEYDSGFGSPKVAEDLVIVGKDFWLERYEYDGAESWKYKSIPEKPQKYIKPTALTIKQANILGYDVSVGWENLKEINNLSTSPNKENNEK